MIPKVLIVDDDLIWLRLIKKQFAAYAEEFQTMTAGDGNDAIQCLKMNPVSLVVTDLQMPDMDGLTLLAYMSKNFPDIPVIIMTAYSTPVSKKKVLEGGAAGYIEKPFVVDDLSDKIKRMLKKETEGGTLQTVPLDMFIQLIEMEQKTCTIRVVNKKSSKKGVLFFRDGDLLDARIHDRKGVKAAYEIFSWDNVTLAIQDECPIQEKRLTGELQAILFDAMRMKDEANAGDGIIQEPVQGTSSDDEPYIEELADVLSPADLIREQYARVSPEFKGLEDIYPDSRWNPLIRQAEIVGTFFASGQLKTCFVKGDSETAHILLPGDGDAMVVAVSEACPRDQILDVFSDSF